MPFGIAPTGFTRVMHSAGERAGAAAAGAAGIPFSLSTVGTTTPEGVAEANPDGRNWFQLYMWRDRDRSTDVMDRAAAAGFDTLLLMVYGSLTTMLLIFFSYAAKRISMATLGLANYLNPTIQFLCAVYLESLIIRLLY